MAHGLARLQTQQRFMDFAEYLRQLRAEALALAGMGLDLQTFISAILDPAQHPKRDAKGAVIVKRETRKQEPGFCGKNPSFWTPAGKPTLAKPNEPCPLQQVLQRLDTAENLKLPLGIGVIPRQPVVVIDVDQKRYASEDEMFKDFKLIFDQNPQLRHTRIETTPSGGRHIYLKVKDLSEWIQPNQSLYCNFTTSTGGPHRGEILTGGNRFCIAAPSMRSDGRYGIRFPDYGHALIEIERLSDIGIYPCSQREIRRGKSRTCLLLPAEVSTPQLEVCIGSEDHLYKLLTEKAQRVLKGELAFNADDRSGTLATLGNELYSWANLAAEYGYDFTDALGAVWNEAVIALGAEDKNDRVFKSLYEDACFSKRDWADQRFVKVMKIASEQSVQPRMKKSAHHAACNTSGEMNMSVEEALTELIRLSSADRIDAKALLPPFLSDALSIIGETIEYDWEMILTVLMVGISGACPLDSRIDLINGDFIQPLIIWAVLLMPTGELKSPLTKRLLLDPWKTSVDAVMKERYQEAIAEWNKQKSEESANGGDFDTPRPRRVQTIITEDRTPQGIERHFVLHERFGKGSVLLLLDEAKDILAEMSAQSNGTSALPFGTWTLPRYDGSGARGAKADEQNERHYSECRLAALFCCQPDVYRAITGDADQTGLAARFITIEQTKVDQRFPTVFPSSHKQRYQKLHQILSDLYAWVCRQSSIHLELTEDALVLFQKEREFLQERKNQTLSDAERGLLNKCHGRIGRIAGILHLLWAFEPHLPLGRLVDTSVGTDSMERAIRLNRYLLSQTVLIRQTSSGNSLSMQKILHFHNTALKVKSPVRITDLRVKPVSAMRLSPAEAEMVANALQELGYGRVSTDEKGKLCYQALKPLSA